MTLLTVCVFFLRWTVNCYVARMGAEQIDPSASGNDSVRPSRPPQLKLCNTKWTNVESDGVNGTALTTTDDVAQRQEQQKKNNDNSNNNNNNYNNNNNTNDVDEARSSTSTPPGWQVRLIGLAENTPADTLTLATNTSCQPPMLVCIILVCLCRWGIGATRV